MQEVGFTLACPRHCRPAIYLDRLDPPKSKTTAKGQTHWHSSRAGQVAAVRDMSRWLASSEQWVHRRAHAALPASGSGTGVGLQSLEKLVLSIMCRSNPHCPIDVRELAIVIPLECKKPSMSQIRVKSRRRVFSEQFWQASVTTRLSFVGTTMLEVDEKLVLIAGRRSKLHVPPWKTQGRLHDEPTTRLMRLGRQAGVFNSICTIT